MKWLWVLVLVVGCSKTPSGATPDPNATPYNYVGPWPTMIGPDGEYCMPWIKVGEIQQYYCYW